MAISKGIPLGTALTLVFIPLCLSFLPSLQSIFSAKDWTQIEPIQQKVIMNIRKAVFTASGLLPSLLGAGPNPNSSCKCFPGDSCWPSPTVWDVFNDTLGGKLVATMPLATACHEPNYNEEACAQLKAAWLTPEVHYDSSSSIMAPWFTNESCTPFSAVDTPCLNSNFIDYAVNVSESQDVAKALSFASEQNIRFVIRNTGHDYNGKSTGAGALGVWMHHLKDITFVDWDDGNYKGKAIKMGAGVQGIEAYQAANKEGYAVVGGECPTVGIAGGYSQGGGHSALSSRFGLAADQTLEFEVVTAKGETLAVNKDNHSDLYWALSGGGGGTYAVVMSLTSKAHPDMPTAGLNLTFTSTNISQDTYYSAVSEYQLTLPQLVDAGAMSVWFFTNESFAISPLTGPGLTAKQLLALIEPFTTYLKSAGIDYTLYSSDFPNYLSEFQGMQGPIDVGIAQYGGWLIPRSVVLNNTAALTQAYREITSDGAMFIGVGVNVSLPKPNNTFSPASNAVLPAWRETLIDTVITTPYVFNDRSDMVVSQQRMTNSYIPKLKALAPQSGVYLSESDFREEDWKRSFYGVNYEKLLQVKNEYDPERLLWVWQGVGSDGWEVDSQGGSLCRV